MILKRKEKEFMQNWEIIVLVYWVGLLDLEQLKIKREWFMEWDILEREIRDWNNNN
jgi:hypothetical protein